MRRQGEPAGSVKGNAASVASADQLAARVVAGDSAVQARRDEIRVHIQRRLRMLHRRSERLAGQYRSMPPSAARGQVGLDYEHAVTEKAALERALHVLGGPYTPPPPAQKG